jgi:branched-chain amino acid aminotransferase
LLIFINDEYLPEEEAKISVFDQGLIFGDGVFDTMIVQNGYIFKLDQHVERLYRSARAVMIEIPYTRDGLKSRIVETVRRNGLTDAYVKCIVTRGKGSKPILSRDETPKPTVIVFAVPPVFVVPPEKIETGARAISSLLKRSHRVSIDPRVKSLNYQPSALLRLEARRMGADEGITYDYEGFVSEGSAENIFVTENGVLKTPSHGVLQGITRETVIELSEQAGYRVVETNLTRYDLYNADEVFMCSTAGGIFSLVEIDGRTIGDGRPGPITKCLIKKYNDMLSSGTHGTPV